MADLVEEFDDGGWLDELEAEFAHVEIPTAPEPRDRIEVECCQDETCRYNDPRVRFFEAGMILSETALQILSAVGILRAHGDDIRADFLEAPYREMIENFNMLGVAAGYWEDYHE